MNVWALPQMSWVNWAKHFMVNGFVFHRSDKGRDIVKMYFCNRNTSVAGILCFLVVIGPCALTRFHKYCKATRFSREHYFILCIVYWLLEQDRLEPSTDSSSTTIEPTALVSWVLQSSLTVLEERIHDIH